MSQLDTFTEPFASERRAQNIRNVQAQARWSDDACAEALNAVTEAAQGMTQEERIRSLVASVQSHLRRLCDFAFRHVQQAITWSGFGERHMYDSCAVPLGQECDRLRWQISTALDELSLLSSLGSAMHYAIEDAERCIEGAEQDQREFATFVLRGGYDVEAVGTWGASITAPHGQEGPIENDVERDLQETWSSL